MKIIKIVDTREYEIVDGIYGGEKKVYFPGTGIKHICEMCGREHEVHAYVESDIGVMSIIGIGCAKKIAGLKDQIKLLDLYERLESVKFPGTWKVIHAKYSDGKCRYDDYGRRIYTVIINDNAMEIHSNSEKDALSHVAKYMENREESAEWKRAISEYYRIKKMIAKYENVA